MIIDVQKFITVERQYWSQLEAILDKLDNNPDRSMSIEEIKEFHYLFQRTSTDLARIKTFSSAPDLQRYVEALVGRAYGEIHATRESAPRFRPWHWFFQIFPQTFRNRIAAFWLAIAITLVGAVFGGAAIALDPEAKAVLMPFPHLQVHPAERVRREEQAQKDRLQGRKAQFSSMLMTHNTKVSIFALALGITFGIGTILLLFYNGVILGAVVVDYVLGGQTIFLLGWLLPHGVVEIPAILIGGQAGLLLAGAMLGRGTRAPLKVRLREVAPDLVTLIVGVGLMLVWAGIIESFLSQYHAPVLPYELKILFGMTELVVLFLYLTRAGLKKTPPVPEHTPALVAR